jgi:5-methylcytosine-specific restriction endonuclease McrA
MAKPTKEEAIIRNGIISALRRYFSRCHIRREVLAAAVHPTKKGKRGGKLYTCNLCKSVVPSSNIQVDHADPVIPVDKTNYEMTLDEYVDRLFWCDRSNLQALCIKCHNEKTTREKSERAKRRRKTPKVKPKAKKKSNAKGV